VRRFSVWAAAGTAVCSVLVFGVAPAYGAVSNPKNAWPATGYDGGQTYWNSKDVLELPARVAAAQLNFTILTAAPTDPAGCLGGVLPVESSGRLFNVGPDGISAYNQWTGERLWNRPVPANLQEYVADAQIAGADLVVTFTGNCNTVTGSTGTVVYVLSTATGALLHPVWSSSFGGVTSSVLAGGVLVTSEFESEGGVSFPTWVVAYTLAGKRLWATPQFWSAGASTNLYSAHPVTGGGRVFVDNPAGRMAALDVSTGHVLWTGAKVLPVALSQDGKDLYATTVAGVLYDVDPATGDPTGWVSVSGRGPGVPNNLPMAVDQTAIYTNCAGNLCATSRSTGHLLWKATNGCTPADNVYPATPRVTSGVVYCAGHTYREPTGARLTSAADGTGITSIAGGRLYGLVRDPTTQQWDIVSYM
jgi:outer membrane protein assembly factor BamB